MVEQWPERAPLLGRLNETKIITGLLDDIRRSGATLVLRGDPGIGKSRLISEATALAEARSIRVLSTKGVQSEAHLAYGGLQQLLRPVRSLAARLPPAARAVLETALGVGDSSAPELFRIAIAVLDLLSEVATDSPLLVVAEDAQWLDRPSVVVLGFIARRIESDPTVLLAAVRPGYPEVFGAGELPELILEPLDAEVAAALLAEYASSLSTATRNRIVHEAAGNPLALVELPQIASRLDDEGLLPGLVPLTERLERAFAARTADLPSDAQTLLLIAALNDCENLAEVLDAGRLIIGDRADIGVLQTAAEATIVHLDERTVRFRHPLVRSALRQSSSVEERRRVHEALAQILEFQPDRRVWHRAALITGPHEDVAKELEETGQRALSRGAIDTAFTASRRAAELSAPAERPRRLLHAGELAVEIGQPEMAVPLLSEVDERSGPIERALATLIEETINLTHFGDANRLKAVVEAAEGAAKAGDHNLYLKLLMLAVHRAWQTDPGPGARGILVEAAVRLGQIGDDPRVLAIFAYADPIGHADEALEGLRSSFAKKVLRPEAAQILGPTALALGALDIAADLLTSASDGARVEGRLGRLPRLLVLHGMAAALLNSWDIAVPAGEEARRLADELGEPLWVAGGETVLSMVAGMRGDSDLAERLAAHAEQVGRTVDNKLTVALAQFGRVLGALGESRHEDAYYIARRLFEATDSAYHPVIARWILADLAEAALHSNHLAEARQLLAQVEETTGEQPAVWIGLNLRHAHALLAPDNVAAQRRFEEALEADLGRWPFQRARIQLSYGEWLRRQRRITDSRAPLRAARNHFDALGCPSWSERARRELRASGERSRRRDPVIRDRLTAQEMQIARLAADGLSNRDIGDRLYLSHRTVSTHLYRIFPKLGVSGRGDLGVALTEPGVDLSDPTP